MRLWSTVRKVNRQFRRALYDWRARGGINLGELHCHQAHALFTRAAAELNLEARQLGRVLCISGKGRVFRVHGPSTDFDTFPLGAVCGDKMLTRALFERHQLSVPLARSFRADQTAEAVRYAFSLKAPCVVKPARDTSSGKGVTANLATAHRIRKAFRFASLFCDEVIIEQFMPGENYRFLIFKGKCISAVHRQYPHVTGNGTDTVRTLVQRENANRIQSARWCLGDPTLLPLPCGAGTLRILRKQGLDWQCAAPAGRKVFLAEICSYATGASFHDVTHLAHPALVAAAESAATAAGTTLAGVDIIAPDIGGPVYWINEINTTPGLRPHYFIENPDHGKDPIRTILRDVFELGPAGGLV